MCKTAKVESGDFLGGKEMGKNVLPTKGRMSFVERGRMVTYASFRQKGSRHNAKRLPFRDIVPSMRT